jgi:hypothetical protein
VVNLLQATRQPRQDTTRYDDWHVFNGNQYFNNVLSSWQPNSEGIPTDFSNLVGRAYKGNGIVFACEMTRVALVSQAPPVWQRKRAGRWGDLFGTRDLDVLDTPWPGGTFKQLAARMVLNADMGGTAFVARRRERPDRLMLLRPDWVTIVLGSQDDPDGANFAMDADYLGVIYQPGGQGQGREPIPLLADECAVWAPIPDPTAAYRGMSWLPPVGREVDADRAASTHKLAFFENGATPGVILSVDPTVKKDAFQAFYNTFTQRHEGIANAYRTIALQGVTPHVVGTDFKQLDFKTVQGAGETRIAAASGVHPVVVALSEGMAGSSLNAGNFRAACRLVADRTLRDMWASMFAALQQIVPAPDSQSRLWYAEKEISFLQEDRKDAAEIEATKAATIAALVREGFEPGSVIAAVQAEDMSLLIHSGLLSVQLQTPGQTKPTIDGSANDGGQLNGKTPRPAIAAGGN